MASELRQYRLEIVLDFYGPGDAEVEPMDKASGLARDHAVDAAQEAVRSCGFGVSHTGYGVKHVPAGEAMHVDG